MNTIADSQEHVRTLWGRQDIKKGDLVRMMRYVIKVSHKGKTLLHNVVTGELVELSKAEEKMLQQLPTAYSPEMEELAEKYYLVSEPYDEHQTVLSLRHILWRLYEAQQEAGINNYTIFPTTACNARCYYCFEKGTRAVTMTDETARNVIDYIATHCGPKKKIAITWFGGEPTVAVQRIDQICKGLREKHIQYQSDMITNGYLFDEEMVDQADKLWNLKSVQICVDGTEANYNKIKAFVHVTDNPYQRVMRNVGLLLNKNIYVSLRMNFDLGNFMDFQDLISEIIIRFKKNPYLQFRVHPVVGEYPDADGNILHGNSEWFGKKVVEMNDIVRDAGFYQPITEVQGLNYAGCMACSNSAVTITAEGNLVRCSEQFGNDQITGNLKEGITNPDIVESWKKFADYPKCRECVLFPACDRLLNCSVGDRCDYREELIRWQEFLAKQKYDSWC